MQNNAAFDLNLDTKVDEDDISVWVKDLKRTWIGDSNLDGEFNSGDFVLVFNAGKYEKDEAANWEAGDWNGDGRFNSGDFVAGFSDGGYEAGMLPSVQAVPEPTCLGLLLPLTCWLLIRVRRS